MFGCANLQLDTMKLTAPYDGGQVMTAKISLLQDAGASCTPRGGLAAMPDVQRPGSTWPLMAASWSGLGLDLSKISDSESVTEAAAILEAALAPAGFQRGMRTVWVIEAVLYYMPLDRAEVLLGALAALSPASQGTMMATCVDTELLEASRNLESGHIFAQLWHFDCDELLASKGYKEHWTTVREPKTTRDIARDVYGADTYVALYGGAECAFISRV